MNLHEHHGSALENMRTRRLCYRGWRLHVTPVRRLTFSSRALWCSNKDLRALRTSTSLETPDGDCACRLTTVMRSDRSCLDTRHSRCSSSSCRGNIGEAVDVTFEHHNYTVNDVRRTRSAFISLCFFLVLDHGDATADSWLCRVQNFTPAWKMSKAII